MKDRVTVVSDMKSILKDMEPRIKAGQPLYSGRAPGNFNMLPREILANWLICAVLNHENGNELYTFSTAHSGGGDGVIVDKADMSGIMDMEHVFIPKPSEPAAVEDLIVEKVLFKMKDGEQYAKGKTLVVFSENNGVEWKPTRAAKRLHNMSSAFSEAWVVHLERIEDGRYQYGVALLTLVEGQAPCWRVEIDADFESWSISRIQ